MDKCRKSSDALDALEDDIKKRAKALSKQGIGYRVRVGVRVKITVTNRVMH